jgi:hypothetical protein
MTIYPNSFNWLSRPHQARGDFLFNGMAVVIDPRLPKEHIADELYYVYPLWAPIYRWWHGHNPAPAFFRQGKQIEQDVCYIAENKIFVSPAMAEQLKVHAKRVDRAEVSSNLSGYSR